MDDARFLTDLRRYWDEIARGGPATRGDLDPRVAATIRRLHTLPDVPPPDPAYARQLRENLMHAGTIPIPRESMQNIVPNGRGVPHIGRQAPQAFAGPWSRRGWTFGALATAALVTVMLVGSLFMFNRFRPFRPEHVPIIVPAIVATPSATTPVADLVWESTGGPNLPFDHPGHLAIDPHGNLWVTDGPRGGFQIFSPDGQFLETWGAPGSGDGQFALDAGGSLASGGASGGGLTTGAAAFDSAGNLYVADTGNHRVQKFGPDRSFLLAWGREGKGNGQFLQPDQVTVDGKGRVYVVDDERNDIQVFDADGTYLQTIGGYGIGDGQFTANGQFMFSVGGALAFDGQGNIWVADGSNQKIQKFSPEGKFQMAFGGYGLSNGKFSSPTDLAVDAEGRVYVADYAKDGARMQIFSPDGAFLAAWSDGRGGGGGGDTATVSLALDGQGNVYISDFDGNRIQKLQLLPPFAPVAQEALAGTPAVSALPGVTEDTELFDQTIDEIPADASGAEVDRDPLAPGDTWQVGTEASNGVGPMLYRVETGSVTLHADGPVQLTRAGGQRATEIAKDTNVVLNSGDIAYLRSGVAGEWHNAGTAPAMLLDAGINTNGSSATILQTSPISAWPITPPGAPAQLTVRQITLAPGARLPNGPAPGLTLVGADSGTLTIVWAARDAPTIATGSAQLPQGSSMDVNTATYVAKELRNDSSEPLTLLVMTVVPVEPRATTATPQASALPANLNSGTVLPQGTFDALPDQAAWLGTERTVLEPGAAWDLNTGPPDASTGPAMYLVESGALTINADGPSTVTRSGTNTPTAVAPGTDVVLHPGDRGMIPLDAASHWPNDGNVPASMIDTRITRIGVESVPSGGSHEVLIDARPNGTLTPPLLVTVQRREFNPGDTLKPATVPGLQGLYVESGSLQVSDAGELGTPAGAFVISAGQERTFGVTSYHEVPSGWTLRSADSTPVTLLFLTMTEGNPQEATPMG
jgi:sugar lactone lactonase YvrE